MSMGPYRYINGQKYTFGSDGRWWHVLYSSGGDDYGVPVAPSVLHARYRHHVRHAKVPRSTNYSSRTFSTVDDSDTLRVRQLASAINRQAGWVGTWQGIGGFYLASFVGAGLVVGAPGAANDLLFGSFEGRIFWSGFHFGALREAEMFAASGAGRVISVSGVGWAFNQVSNRIADWSVVNYLWGVLSKVWAYGAEGPIDAFIAQSPGRVWQEIEYPILWSADGFTRLFSSATPIVFHTW